MCYLYLTVCLLKDGMSREGEPGTGPRRFLSNGTRHDGIHAQRHHHGNHCDSHTCQTRDPAGSWEVAGHGGNNQSE